MPILLHNRLIDPTSISIEGIDTHDYPDFCDAFVGSARFLDTGEELTDEELEKLTDQGWVGEYILDNQLYWPAD